MRIIIALLLALTTFGLAHDVVFKNGTEIHNAKKVEKGTTFWLIHTADRQKIKVHYSLVESDDTAAGFDPAKPTTITGEIPQWSPPVSDKRHPHLALLPISGMALIVAADYFGDAGDIGDAIKSLRDADPDADVEDLRGRKSRKEFTGAMLILGAAINTWIAFKGVTVTATPNEVKLAITF